MTRKNDFVEHFLQCHCCCFDDDDDVFIIVLFFVSSLSSSTSTSKNEGLTVDGFWVKWKKRKTKNEKKNLKTNRQHKNSARAHTTHAQKAPALKLWAWNCYLLNRGKPRVGVSRIRSIRNDSWDMCSYFSSRWCLCPSRECFDSWHWAASRLIMTMITMET